jgi:acyl-coenzyme A thioesterase PaaI-like protein
MRFSVSPRLFRLALNSWPPFAGPGIRVTQIAADWSYVWGELRQNPLNRNALGTHFGGSLFAMTDPFYALRLMHQLGRDYGVWDPSATIDFLKPGRGGRLGGFSARTRARRPASARGGRWR